MRASKSRDKGALILKDGKNDSFGMGRQARGRDYLSRHVGLIDQSGKRLMDDKPRKSAAHVRHVRKMRVVCCDNYAHMLHRLRRYARVIFAHTTRLYNYISL